MFEYFYFICTKPIKNKYSIKKMIYNNRILYQEEDSLLTINQVNKLIKSLLSYQYKKINDSKLHKDLDTSISIWN